MNLSFDKKDVFSILNTKEAEAYIGQEGFIADTATDIQREIEKNRVRILESVSDADIYCFGYGEDGDVGGLFLPTEKVKKVEKEWKPFTLDKFNEVFDIGQIITFRKKDSDYHGKWLYTGYAIDGKQSTKIVLYLGCHYFVLPELFECYEYQDANGNWNLFGVETEE